MESIRKLRHPHQAHLTAGHGGFPVTLKWQTSVFEQEDRGGDTDLIRTKTSMEPLFALRWTLGDGAAA